MPYRAWAYIWGVFLIGSALSVLTFASFASATAPWLIFAALTLLATIAQLFKAEAQTNHVVFSASPVFYFAGVLLLPPFLFVLLITIPHLVEWAKERLNKSERLANWYIQPFNIGKYIITGVTSSFLHNALLVEPGTISISLTALPAIAVAATSYLFVNQSLLGLVLVLARGVSWRDSGVLDVESLLPEFIMVCLGLVVAALCQLAPLLIVPALAPLVLMYRSLLIPQLKQEAQTDAKTGLLNARHFNKVFADELERARRFNRPLAVIMADLDLLRNINNTYGHLAGDIVIAGIGQLIRKTIREYDIAGRFGGEEFMIVLPEAGRLEAETLAERLRHVIASTTFEVPTSSAPISATMSLGIACFPEDAATATDLAHEADVAVYLAKRQGRNRVACATDVPQTVKFIYGATTGDYQATTPAEASPAVHAPLNTGAAPGHQAVLPQPAELHDVQMAARPEHAPSPITGAVPADAAPSKPGAASMSFAAWPYIWGVLIAGLGLFSLSLVWYPATTIPWLPFGVLVGLASLAQLYRAEGPHRTLFHATPIFYFAGVLMLPPQLFVLLVVIPLLAEWARERWNGGANLRAWYLQPFNVAMYTIAGTATYTVLQTLQSGIGGLSSSSLPVIATVALTYVTVSQVILGLALRLARGVSWRESGVLTEGLLTEFVLASLGYVMTVHWHISPWLIVLALTPLVLIYRSLTVPKLQAENMQALHRMNQQLSQANQAIHQLNDELFLTLAKIFDARDPYVGGHAAQVAHYAVAIAEELGFTDERLQIIRQAGYLHDIGKMAIPESILHKPSKLTNEEYDLIKRHAALGAEFLETSQGLRHLAPFVRHHHERWDGRGYPDCLQGEEIPIEARILNVCDSVEAMAADRPYHRGMSLDEIIAEIQRCSGTQFDPTIAEVFIRIAEREGDRFVVNSARVVEQRTVRISPLSLMNTVLFSPVYQPAD